MVVDLVSQLHVGRARGKSCVGDHCAAACHVTLLERQPRRGEARTCAGEAHRMLAHEPLQVLICRRAIATRLFELGE